MKILYLEDSADIEELINALNNMHPSDFNSSYSLDIGADHILFPASKFISFFGCPKCRDFIDLGFLKINMATNEVVVNGFVVFLPRREYELLVYLVSQSPRIISKDKLFVQIWCRYDGITSNTIDVHINRLRRKIGKNHIICVKGFGYKFVVD